MKLTLLTVSLALTAVLPVLDPATAPEPTPAPSPAGQVMLQDADQGAAAAGDRVVIAFGEEGERVVELLDLASELLELPVIYSPQELGDTEIHMQGSLDCPRAEFRARLDGLLLDKGFVTWDSEEGGRAMHVRAINSIGPRGSSRAMLPGQIVDMERGPTRNTATYTAVFALEHIEARSAMASFNPYLDSLLEGLRNVENSNALIVTGASMEKLRTIRDLVAVVDVPSPRAEHEPDALEQLEQRVASLEEALAER